jgi:outer membrane protein assembly factor BamB
MTHRQLALAALALLAGLSLADSPAREGPANWTQWRGPSGQGFCDDSKAPLSWSETENLLWKTKLPGAGNSTPIVWGDRVFLTAAGARGAERHVLCIRASDGKVLWQRTPASAVGPEKSHVWNGWASPSCATDGSHVYAFFGTPGLFCYDMDGKEVWRKTFGEFKSNEGWGTGASPFLFGDTVIVNCDNDGGPGAAPAALVALDKRTGKQRWSTPRDQGRGFSTPRLIPVAGGRIDLVLNGPLGVWGYDPATGKERWRCTRSDPNDLHRFGEPMPVNDDRMLFVASGRVGPVQGIRLPGSGDVTRTHVAWEKPRGQPRRDVASPILWGGKVYCLDRNALLTCYNLKTGKELFASPLGKRGAKSMASPIALRGHLLWLLDDGTTVVVKPGDKLQVVRRNSLGRGQSLDFGASPAVSAGRIFFRSQATLYCVGEKK